MTKTIFGLVLWISMLAFTNGTAQFKTPTPLKDIVIGAELSQRAQRNYERLELENYSPARVFTASSTATASAEWPGDMEGRIILALVMEAQANHREPKHLQTMIDMIPVHLNSQGYFGPIQKKLINEQQLSGNGWFLRGLCEYYLWKKDEKILGYIKNIINNLVLPTAGAHSTYPIDPSVRKANVGGASGSNQGTVGQWILSSDTGCDFIFMDGVIQAYSLLPSPELKNVINEMMDRFMQMDMVAIKAQTHATLTGLRAGIRLYEHTKSTKLLQQVKERFDLYRLNAMTANYENFNWFGRPEWTEPCAIVDSYMLATQLWQHTGEPVYLETAHHIYYNGLSNVQRANGGFGLSNCPIPGNNSLKVEINEADWCCTMRGAEGLASAVSYNYFTAGRRLVVPFYNSSEAMLTPTGGDIALKQTSSYPMAGQVEFEVTECSNNDIISLELFAPSWSYRHKLYLNGRALKFKISGGFLIADSKLQQGDRLVLKFGQRTSVTPMENEAYAKPGYYSIKYGPLVLGYENTKTEDILFRSIPKVKRISDRAWVAENQTLTPVFHIMDPTVNKENGHSKQVLFQIGILGD